MDVFDEDLLRFWECLNRYTVRYIMVGGFATYFHGFERTTEDLDIWIDDTIVNRQNLRLSLKEINNFDFPAIETMDFVPGWTSLNIGTNIELDIMTSMKGLEDTTFNECLMQASIVNLDGIEIPFLHINQLILNKKTVNRPKDQVDVVELEKIKKLRDEDKHV